MAQAEQSHILLALARVLPKPRIEELARQLGAVKRQRNVDIVELVYALVLGFAFGSARTLSGLKRAYELATGKSLARSSFHERFNAPLASLLRLLTTEALEVLSNARPQLRAAFKPFVEVLAIDSTIIRLHEGLRNVYPSIWSHHTPASVKLTLVTNVVGRGPKSFQLAPGSRHDVRMLSPGPWVRARLLLFDLGFYQCRLFEQIDAHGGFFLSRLRKQVKPLVLKSHREQHVHLEGTRLNPASDCLDRETIDVEGQLDYVLKEQKHRHATVGFRIVCVYNQRDGCWHRYVTNAPPSMLQAEAVTAVYAARWEIELLFRELKSNYRIDDLPSSNLHASEGLLFASLLTLIVSRKLTRLVCMRSERFSERMTADRWGVLFAAIASELLALALSDHAQPEREERLLDFLLREAPDPNRSRRSLPTRAQDGGTAFA